jgi:hypothetical protein
MTWTTKIPNLIYISAPRGSGKTYLIVQMLMNEELYLKQFDKIFIFSPSLSDSADNNLFDLLGLPDNQMFDKFDEKKLAKIIKYKKRKPEEQWLIVCDDCIGESAFKNSELARILSYNGRHLGISFWVTSQKATAGSTCIRTNADQSIFFCPRSMNEIEALYRDSAINGITKKQFVKLLTEATKEKYGFLNINYTEKEVWYSYSKQPLPEPDF